MSWNSFQPALTDAGEHVCYFCAPRGYPPMPTGYTLCARCGTFIHAGYDDLMNEAMEVCSSCEEALGILANG